MKTVKFVITIINVHFITLKMSIFMKQSGVDPTPEGSLTLESTLLWGVFNWFNLMNLIGLDILDSLTRLNITKYQAQFSEFLY